MFEHIGGKLKTFAKFSAWFGIMVSLLLGATIIISMEAEFTLIGGVCAFMVMTLGSLFAWISSWALYAFGELVENVEAVRLRLEAMQTQSARRGITRDEIESIRKQELEDGLISDEEFERIRRSIL